MSFDAPCRGCDRRNARCHASCEEYKTWRAERDAKNARIAKAKKVDADYINMSVENVERAFKKNNNFGRARKKRVGKQ